MTGIAEVSASGTTDSAGSATGSVAIEPSDTDPNQTVTVDGDGTGGAAPTDVAVLDVVLPSGVTDVSDTGNPDVLVNA